MNQSYQSSIRPPSHPPLITHPSLTIHHSSFIHPSVPAHTHPSYRSGSPTERTAGCSAGRARRRCPPRRSGTSGTSRTGRRELERARGRPGQRKNRSGSLTLHVLLTPRIIIILIIAPLPLLIAGVYLNCGSRRFNWELTFCVKPF